MNRLTQAGLCEGYGGLSQAVCEVFGAELVWYSEIEPAACRLLAHHHSDIPNVGDLTTVDWEGVRDMPRGAPLQVERGQAMYDRYCQGLSLAEVGTQFGVSRQTVYMMFKRRAFDMRRRSTPAPFVEFNGERYTLDESNGYYRKTRGDRAKLHRDMWRHEVGPIPEGWDIHHRDHDKTHNVISNFECLPKDEHAHLHGTGCNGSVHRCGKEEVMPTPAPAVDILTAGWP